MQVQDVIYEVLEDFIKHDHRIIINTTTDEPEESEKLLEEMSEEIRKAVGNHVCDVCGGSGEIATMEKVYPGEPHMADIGEPRPCPNLPHTIID